MSTKQVDKSDRYSVEAIKKAIEIIGGAEKLARKLEISYAAVLNWRNGRKVPTAINCMLIEKLTEGKVTKEEILPSFPWEKLK